MSEETKWECATPRERETTRGRGRPQRAAALESAAEGGCYLVLVLVTNQSPPPSLVVAEHQHILNGDKPNVGFSHFFLVSFGGLGAATRSKSGEGVDDDGVFNKRGVVFVCDRDRGITVAHIVYQLNLDCSLAEAFVGVE